MKKLCKKQQLFVITMEECGELAQVCSKALRKRTTDLQNLKDEIGDVYAMIDLMTEKGIVSWSEIHDRAREKRSKLAIWSDLTT
jgi:NTP pyrophosphatase (non-canonical NTP hydrolase)